MTKKLQVILQECEYREIQRTARLQRISLAEWVRRTLARACSGEKDEVQRKLDAIRIAALHEFPTADINTMLAEIERNKV